MSPLTAAGCEQWILRENKPLGSLVKGDQDPPEVAFRKEVLQMRSDGSRVHSVLGPCSGLCFVGAQKLLLTSAVQCRLERARTGSFQV